MMSCNFGFSHSCLVVYSLLNVQHGGLHCLHNTKITVHAQQYGQHGQFLGLPVQLLPWFTCSELLKLPPPSIKHAWVTAHRVGAFAI